MTWRIAGAVILALLVLVPGGRLGAQEVGRFELNGREVVLFEGGTWRYALSDEPVGPECTGLVRLTSERLPLSYCLNEEEWVRDQASGAFEALYVHRQTQVYLGVITEPATVTTEALRSAILSSAQRAAGLNEVEVVSSEERELNGVDWLLLKFRATISGVDLIYWNYSHAGPGVAAQFIFWGTEEDAVVGEELAERVTQTLRLSM